MIGRFVRYTRNGRLALATGQFEDDNILLSSIDDMPIDETLEDRRYRRSWLTELKAGHLDPTYIVDRYYLSVSEDNIELVDMNMDPAVGAELLSGAFALAVEARTNRLLTHKNL